MKLIITGGAGFIGSHFVELFTKNQFPEIAEIVIVDALTYAGKLSNVENFIGDPRVSFHNLNIADFQSMVDISKNKDVIINFAAESHVDNSIKSSFEFVHTNVLGTQCLLEAARLNKLKRFIQVSTDEVYGSISQGSWNEESPLLPNSPYAASKAAADLLVRSYSVTHKLDVNITRCSNNYGPRQHIEKFIPTVVDKLKNGFKIPVYGDGSNTRDWLHVTDHCRGIYRVLLSGNAGEIYNIGGGTELTNIELSKLILSFMNLDSSQIEFVPDRKGHDQRYSVNWKKISEIGYSPQENFINELKKTVDWYQ